MLASSLGERRLNVNLDLIGIMVDLVLFGVGYYLYTREKGDPLRIPHDLWRVAT